jgi:iron complex transport system substrate-binding protein
MRNMTEYKDKGKDKMKFSRIMIILALISFLALAGCQAAVTPGNITDDLGRSVQINKVPQRIISLSPSNTEIVYALGLQDRLIGVTTFCNYPPEVRNKPKVSEFSNVDVEKIVSLEPDLILASDIHKTEVVPALEKLGIQAIVIRPGTVDEVMSDIGMVGNITGKIKEAGELTSSLGRRVKAVTDKTANLKGEKPRIFYVTWYDPLWTAGGNTMINDLIEKAGGSNIAVDLEGYSTISLETVLEKNPQIIIVPSSMGDQDTSLNYINTEPRLKAVDAIKNKQVYVVDSDVFSRTTPRIVDGLEQLAKIIHPELFK